MVNLKKVGLTGGIASGKSTTIDMLIKRGFKIIDSDKIVKKILNEDIEVLEYIKSEFGDRFINNGKLLKREFGDYIFTYDYEKIKYENFIMNKIFYEINRQFLFHENNNEKLCILDAPLLIEKNLHKDMDYVVLVWVSENKQLERLLIRDDINEESAIKRIRSQMNIDLKKQFANFILDNSKNIEYLRGQVEMLCSILKNL